jgi:hypothetical protein
LLNYNKGAINEQTSSNSKKKSEKRDKLSTLSTDKNEAML